MNILYSSYQNSGKSYPLYLSDPCMWQQQTGVKNHWQADDSITNMAQRLLVDNIGWFRWSILIQDDARCTNHHKSSQIHHSEKSPRVSCQDVGEILRYASSHRHLEVPWDCDRPASGRTPTISLIEQAQSGRFAKIGGFEVWTFSSILLTCEAHPNEHSTTGTFSWPTVSSRFKRVSRRNLKHPTRKPALCRN